MYPQLNSVTRSTLLLGDLWLPDKASTISPAVDSVFNLILGVCVFFFAIVVVSMIVMLVRYRYRPGVEPQESPSHNMRLEIVWSVIPLGIVLLIFWHSFTVFMDMYTVPKNAYEIHVTAKKWSWMFEYPNGHVEENLHVPINTPVRLIMSSQDVIHSLWIPEFRVKMDIPPGRYTATWFEATELGEYNLLCTEYCGELHSDMLALVVVHPPDEFEEWLADAANFMEKYKDTPEKAGEILFQKRGCAQCHWVDKAKPTAPGFRGIFGKTHELQGGETVVVDENYIRQSILEPQAKIRAGYPANMPTYKGMLKEDEIKAIIAYIKSLK
jgi:cytochrome c oxidase subunit 2